MTRAAILGIVAVTWLLGAASAQETAPQAVRARVPAAKALADKEKAARADVEAARQVFKEAKGAQARLEAADKVAAALSRLVEAQKQLLQAQEAAVQVRLPATGRDSAERDTVHPDDPIERFALLTPGGPLVVEAALTIDGKPFRQAREALIRDLIAAADKDKDGKTTWTEALTSPRFTLGRIGSPNEQTRAGLIRNFDKNSDEIVDPDEARKLIAQFFQGGTFSLGSGAGFVRVLTANGVAFGGANNQANLLELLDTDKDKSLDAKELAAAASRLKSRDADDNDLLAADEVSGVVASPVQRVDPRGVLPAVGAVLLGPAATRDGVYTLMVQRYKNLDNKLAPCFPLFPQLFDALDEDGDGVIGSREILGLNDVEPHVRLSVDLATDKIGDGLKIKSLAPELTKTQEATESKVIELPGVRISLAASVGPPPRQNFDSFGASLLARFDKDNNGYLELSEMVGADAQFAMFDLNDDGKAYPAEISAGYARQFAPQMTQVVANVVHQGNSLFQTLDTSGDGRLSLREMRAAAERIAALDKNQDGIVGGTEIPETINVSFELGRNSPYAFVASAPGLPPRPRLDGPNRGAPEWFTRMDRNGDGDVTLKEFLGSEADFKRLDTNSDGFLDPQEAKAAASK